MSQLQRDVEQEYRRARREADWAFQALRLELRKEIVDDVSAKVTALVTAAVAATAVGVKAQ